MNIHPIVVHFPIAFLTVYALLECLRIRSVRDNMTWHVVKTVLLCVGVFGSFVALQTGEIAQYLIGRSALIRMHSFWAGISTYIFSFLFFVYGVIVLQYYYDEKIIQSIGTSSFATIFLKLIRFITVFQRSVFVVLFALAGLVAITITGALGGAIIYGVNSDPIVSFIYYFFFPK